jgi:hypothetical protein
MYVKTDYPGGWKFIYKCLQFGFNFDVDDDGGDILHLELVRQNDQFAITLTQEVNVYVMDESGNTIDSIRFRPRIRLSEPESCSNIG